MKDKAADTAEAAKQAGADVAGVAADNAKHVAQETTRQARDLAAEARGQLAAQAGQYQDSLVKNLHALADELAGMARHSTEPGVATELVDQAADHARSVAQWFQARPAGELLNEVRSFARQHPAAFLFGAAAAGVAAGRLTRGAVAVHNADEPQSSSGNGHAPRLDGGAYGVGQYPAAGAYSYGEAEAALGSYPSGQVTP